MSYDMEDTHTSHDFCELGMLLEELADAFGSHSPTKDGWDRVFCTRDEDVLPGCGFKPSSTHAGWHGVDINGHEWYAHFDEGPFAGQGGVVWYHTHSNGMNERLGTLKYSEFKQLFDRKHNVN